MSDLFKKTRKHPDRCMRCYLTLACDSQCAFCSAQVPEATDERRATQISAELWAEGLNARARHTILAGGEPLLYRRFADLIRLIKPGYKVEIYTNLNHDVEEFLAAAGQRKYMFLISLHPSAKLTAWRQRVEQLAEAGHSLRFHVVKSGGFTELAKFLIMSGIVGRFQTALQGDQRSGIKSSGAATNERHPWVRCTSRIYLFGPDGYRYHCVHQLVRGNVNFRLEPIWQPDTPIQTQLYCDQFGLCAGCDNNIEGKVEDVRQQKMAAKR